MGGRRYDDTNTSNAKSCDAYISSGGTAAPSGAHELMEKWIRVDGPGNFANGPQRGDFLHGALLSAWLPGNDDVK